jgi:hypothetical protein
VISGRRKEKLTWTDRWGPHVSEAREKPGYRFGVAYWAAAGFWCWAGMAPPAFLFFFDFFFFFLFYQFFNNFCKYISIQIKLLPEIFKKDCTIV